MVAAAIEHLEEALKLAADAHVPRSQSNELKADIESKLDAVKQAIRRRYYVQGERATYVVGVHSG